MNEDQLYDLINQLNTKEVIRESSKSIKWHACQLIEKINDISVFDILIKIIKENQQKKNKNIRNAAYYIIGIVLKHNFSNEVCQFLIHQLEKEEDKNIISNILSLLSNIVIPYYIDIRIIATLAKHDKWQIRNNAIIALGSSASKISREALLYYINQDDEKKYKYEIIYANSSLSKIGIREDINFLEKHINSRIPDIRYSARLAIENIKITHNTFQ